MRAQWPSPYVLSKAPGGGGGGVLSIIWGVHAEIILGILALLWDDEAEISEGLLAL